MFNLSINKEAYKEKNVKSEKWNILIWETKKICQMPMFWGILIFCLLVNMGIAARGVPEAEYLNYLKQANELTDGKMGEEFQNRLLTMPDGKLRTELTDETQELFDIFDDFSAAEIGELYFSIYDITGSAKDRLTWKYEQLQNAVDQLSTVDASMSLAAADYTDYIFYAMVSRVFRVFLTEIMLFGVLLALWLTGYEKSVHSDSVVFCTKAGRKIQYFKLTAGMGILLFAYLVLGFLTILSYAVLWDIGPIWASNVSSQFHKIHLAIFELPFITWASFSFAGYLAASFGLGAVCSVIAYLFAFTIGTIFNDSYKSFAVFAVATAGNIGVLLLSGRNQWWYIYQIAQWTPFALWQNQPLWFTEQGPGTVLPWQECWVALVYMAIGIITVIATQRYNKRKDI